MDRIDELLQTPYWIIDILPMQVPQESAGQYFAIEKYFLSGQFAAVKQKHINTVLKLNCYMDVYIDGEMNPAPGRIAEMMKERTVCILLGDAMILAGHDDLHMTLFNSGARLLELIKAISASEGLFVWKG